MAHSRASDENCCACFIIGFFKCCSDTLRDGCDRLLPALLGSGAAGVVSSVSAGLLAHYVGEFSPPASALIALGTFAVVSSSTCAAICCCPRCKKSAPDEERGLIINGGL